MTTNDENSQEPDFTVPEELIAEYLEKRRHGTAVAKEFYFANLMPLMKEPLELLPEHKTLCESGFHTLVSMMGYSPETTVQTALILRPKKLVIVYSEEDNCQAIARPGIEYLQHERIVSFYDVTFIGIDAFDPQDIYDKVRSHILGLENVVVDITGGTKVMSSTAGALAWEMNLPMCYLNGGWNPDFGAAGLKRISRLTLLGNPSRSRGYQYRREALSAYGRGNFSVAAERFEASRRLIDDSFFDSLGLELCRSYTSLADFDRHQLSVSLDRLSDLLDNGGVRALIRDRRDFIDHIDALKQFSGGDLLSMTAGFMELADIYSQQGRYDVAGFLHYRSMEALVEWGLKDVAPDFKMNRPDWSLLIATANAGITNEADLQEKYSTLSPDGESKLPPRVGLVSGFGLLCLFTDLGKRFSDGGNRMAISMMMNLGQIRNRSYLAHGLENLTASDAERLSDGARDVADAVLREHADEFKLLRQRLRPRDLSAITQELVVE